MAFRVGGLEGLLKAVECKNVCTAVFSSGLQVSGVLTDVGMGRDNEVTFLRTTGASSLAFDNKELPGHNKVYHVEGFSSPVGKLKGFDKALEDLSEKELEVAGIITGKTVDLDYESGIQLRGKVENIERRNHKNILISFSDCSVTDEAGKVLFDPSWGNYDMAVGEKIISVFSGAADKDAYEEIALKSDTPTFHPHYDERTKQYHSLYQTVRDVRENHSGFEQLSGVWSQLKDDFRDDWLCSMEILEILDHEELMPELAREIRIFLEMKAAAEPEYSKLINDGFYLIKHPVSQANLSV
jgi:phenylalanine-4-hydroxylase